MDVKKRALLVGIDHYQPLKPLTGCVADVKDLHGVLRSHQNGDSNYDCQLLISDSAKPVTGKLLDTRVKELFQQPADHVLFYFSGHGMSTQLGAFLVAQDGTRDAPGLRMEDLLRLADQSKAQSVLLILDCCYAGQFGNPMLFQGREELQKAFIREGITILAASRTTEHARESGGHGVFTKLVLGALCGGAADVRGRVSAASIYAYVEQVLDAWEQRPMYKSHAAHLPPVRLCKPAVPDRLLRELPKLFPHEDSTHSLTPAYEFTDPSARPSKVKIFNMLKILRNAHLLTTQGGKDLFFIALESGWVRLTPLGQFYWMLAKKNRL